jgi:hypothetical protein
MGEARSVRVDGAEPAMSGAKPARLAAFLRAAVNFFFFSRDFFGFFFIVNFLF